MEFDPKDHALVKLLTELKNANGEYPRWLWESRRESYLKQVANIGMAGGFGLRPANSIKRGKTPPGGAPGTSTLLEIILVVAIIAEAGTVAYFYRDKITTLIRSSISSTRVEEVNSPNPVSSTSPITSVTSSESQTPTIPPSGTPTPGSTLDNNSAGDEHVTSTPDPNGNNGNHYGQTPKPERTKKPGNGSNGSNDKPPKPKKTP